MTSYDKDKLVQIRKAIESYYGDDSIYAKRKVLKLNELAQKIESKYNK